MASYLAEAVDPRDNVRPPGNTAAGGSSEKWPKDQSISCLEKKNFSSLNWNTTCFLLSQRVTPFSTSSCCFNLSFGRSLLCNPLMRRPQLFLSFCKTSFPWSASPSCGCSLPTYMSASFPLRWGAPGSLDPEFKLSSVSLKVTLEGRCHHPN